jgi:hypothetical protein
VLLALVGELAFVARPLRGQIVEARAGLDALPDRVATREQIDRGNLVDELVRASP